MKKLLFYWVFLLVLFSCKTKLDKQTFSNPLLPSGPDPWSIYVDGYYYYTHTMGNRLDIWKTDNLASLESAERKTVYIPPTGTVYSRNLWAPEIHFLNGEWYVYFAADDGENINHRMYVIQNSGDPMQDEWNFLGEVGGMSDHWAIDGTVYRYRDQLYFAWSGWEGDVNGQQNIYIAKMDNPSTVSGERVKLSSPEHSWERNGRISDTETVFVNEGPQFLEKNNRLFVIYSASGCWTDHYALGMLSLLPGGDPLSSEQWDKTPEPVFSQSTENKVYAPGHNSFFKSPDGKEDWILYHANDAPGMGCGPDRSPRAQKFEWDESGIPRFGVPVATTERLEIPT